MKTSAFSWADIGPGSQELGKTLVLVVRRPAAVTWKSLNTTRPHCTPASPSGSGGGLTGVFQVRCWVLIGLVVLFGFGP